MAVQNVPVYTVRRHGEPFFMLGDTWWSIPTFRYRWYDDDMPRAMGPKTGFKDMVKYRAAQEYNCLALIVAFPHWANDDRPSRWTLPDGTVVRAAWPQAGTQSAKDMHNEAGERPFLFPGKIPGHEQAVPDLERINPKYFHTLDKKIDFLNAKGIIPFMEVARPALTKRCHTKYARSPWTARGAGARPRQCHNTGVPRVRHSRCPGECAGNP